MKSTEFTKNKAAVIKTLEQLPDNSIRTKTGCKAYIPKRFIERGIASIGNENYSLGIFPIVLATGEYLLFNVIAFVYLTPSAFNSVVIDGEDFIEFTFDPNTTVIKTMDLVQKDTLVYSVFNEFVSSGNIPWYVDYIDAGALFDTAGTIAGTSIGKNPETVEILIATISRKKKEKMEYFRTSTKEEILKTQPVYVPLKSVSYSATNTTNKLAGAYFDEGVASALINPTTKADTIGTILRK